jgi:parallel beta-helix repeat protein
MNINKLIFKATLCVLSIFVISSSVFAATFYVDAANGNDSNNGLSETTTWKTIAKVNASRFNPGDQILFKRGELWREQLTVPSSGTSDKLITFGSYGVGSQPSIYGSENVSDWHYDTGYVYASQLSWLCKQVFQDGQRLMKKQSHAELVEGSWFQNPSSMMLYVITKGKTTPAQYLIEASKRKCGIKIYQKSYIRTEGFTIKQTNDIGAIYIAYSVGNEINGSDISFSYGTGILIENSSNTNLITENRVSFCHYDEGNYQFYSSNGIMIRYGSNENIISSNESFSNYGSGIFISNSSNNIIDKNNIHDNGAGGIDVNDQESTNNIVKDNLVYRNGQIDTNEQGISFFNAGTGNIAKKNIVYEQKGGPDDGIGIMIDTTANQVIVEKNIVFSNSGHGLSIWNSKNGVLRNNTSYGNFRNGIFVGGKDSSGAEIINNIASENALNQLSFQIDAVSAGGYIVSHNNFYKAGVQKVLLFNDRSYSAEEFNSYVPGSDLYQNDPIFVSPITDFSLSAASPCIDKGINIGLLFIGSAPDLGALEYGENTKPACPVRLRIL